MLHLKAVHWNLLKTILSQAFLKGFAIIACDVNLYWTVKNLIIYFAETFQCFPHDQFSTLLLFSYQILIMSEIVYTCLKVAHQKLLVWTSVEKSTSTRCKLAFSFVSSRNELTPFSFEKYGALISTFYFHVTFWPRKYKKYTLFFISKLVNKG